MQNFLRWIDETAVLQTENRVVLWLERIAFIFLILMTLSAPHSIAATQTAWLLGMTAWFVRLFFRPRVKFKIGLIDYALWGYFAWSVMSSVFSYAPDISLDKLRGVSVFLIFYFVFYNVRSRRAAQFLAGALIFSAMFAVLWTPLERIIGRGVQIYEFRGGPFEQIGLHEGDAILRVNGEKVSSLEEIRQKIENSPKPDRFKALVYHSDAYAEIEIPRERVKQGVTAEEALSVRAWQKGRKWRAAGFYGHYTTFAEMLQLVMSLTFGLFIALISQNGLFKKNSEEQKPFANKFFSPVFLFLCLALMAFALLLTVTRASQLAFLISAFGIVLLAGNRKIILALTIVVLPLALIGLFVLQKTRNVGFFDAKDNSTAWRQTVYREGLDLWTANARNFTLGVGMDSVRRYAKDWRLFDDGRLPTGHFHSTPLQLAVERGLPGLLFWLFVLAVYARTLWRYLKIQNPKSKIQNGIIYGCFGGALGFFISGMVHYNLGDTEVAMIFFWLMGLAFAQIGLMNENNTFVGTER